MDYERTARANSQVTQSTQQEVNLAETEITDPPSNSPDWSIMLNTMGDFAYPVSCPPGGSENQAEPLHKSEYLNHSSMRSSCSTSSQAMPQSSPNLSTDSGINDIDSASSTSNNYHDSRQHESYSAGTSKDNSKGAHRRKRPEDLQKNLNKINKPYKCEFCDNNKGHSDQRDLNRHMVTTHRPIAAEMGLDVSKVSCRYCPQEFDRIRKDRLNKHIRLAHKHDQIYLYP